MSSLFLTIDQNTTIQWRFIDSAATQYLHWINQVASGFTPTATPGKSHTLCTISADPEIQPPPITEATGQLLSDRSDMRIRQTAPDQMKMTIDPRGAHVDHPEVRQLFRIVGFGLYPLIQKSQALLLHGALIRQGKAAVILAGAGGNGKTTCFRRVTAPWQGCGDDALLVRRTSRGEFRVRALPTWSQFYYDRPFFQVNCAEEFELAGLYRIIKDERDFIEPIDCAAAFHTGMNALNDFRNWWAFPSDSDLLRRMRLQAVNFLMELVDTPQLRRGYLHCTLNGKFWELLDVTPIHHAIHAASIRQNTKLPVPDFRSILKKSDNRLC